MLSDFTHRDLLKAMVGFKKGKRHLVEVELAGFDHLVPSPWNVLHRQNLPSIAFSDFVRHTNGSLRGFLFIYFLFPMSPVPYLFSFPSKFHSHQSET